jgi:hypothetical protein
MPGFKEKKRKLLAGGESSWKFDAGTARPTPSPLAGSKGIDQFAT